MLVWHVLQVKLVGTWVVDEYCLATVKLLRWQVAQTVAATTVWFIFAGLKTAGVVWQFEQAALLVGMWPAGSVPPVAPWNVVVEVWQVSQAAVVATCVVDLPLAPPAVNDPLWHVAQPVVIFVFL